MGNLSGSLLHFLNLFAHGCSVLLDVRVRHRATRSPHSDLERFRFGLGFVGRHLAVDNDIPSNVRFLRCDIEQPVKEAFFSVLAGSVIMP